MKLDWNGEEIMRKFLQGKVKYEKETAGKIAGKARATAPVGKTGNLKGSIRAKKSKNKDGGYVVLIGDEGTDVKTNDGKVTNYASLVELGTPKTAMSAKEQGNRGFFRRAMLSNWKSFKEDLEDYMDTLTTKQGL